MTNDPEYAEDSSLEVAQLPEFEKLTIDPLGYASRGSGSRRWVTAAPEADPNCRTPIHELAHLAHYAVMVQSAGEDFENCLAAAYRAALNGDLWAGQYAREDEAEYFAEAFEFWVWGSVPSSLAAEGTTLAEYDAAAEALVTEVFNEVTLPTSCDD